MPPSLRAHSRRPARSRSAASSISPAGRCARPRGRSSTPTSCFRCPTTPTSTSCSRHVEEAARGARRRDARLRGATSRASSPTAASPPSRSPRPRSAARGGRVTAYRAPRRRPRSRRRLRGKLAKIELLARALRESTRSEPRRRRAPALRVSVRRVGGDGDVGRLGDARARRRGRHGMGPGDDRRLRRAIGDLGEAVGLLLPGGALGSAALRRGGGLVLPRASRAPARPPRSRPSRGRAAALLGGRGEVPSQDALGGAAHRRRRHDGGRGDRRGLRRGPRGRGPGAARLRRHRRDRGGRAGRAVSRGSASASFTRSASCSRARSRRRRRSPEELADFAVEDKFDGIRAHAHKAASRVALFSRTLDDVTAQFPEIAAALAGPREVPARRRDRGVARRGATDPTPSSTPPAAARPKGPARRAPRRDPGGVHRLRLPRPGGEPLFEGPWRAPPPRLEEIAARRTGELLLSDVFRAASPAELESLFDAGARPRQRGPGAEARATRRIRRASAARPGESGRRRSRPSTSS